ncbi:helix-turn-helix domain-containing protein [Nitratireductor sp. CH_MIT9313-5]|uniref:helix-turn-helix domain-containing protein n=1 Tax=Nitratireductor sp. CH_MIT9313-5 TaxID=3107764 RepID=UPI003FA56EAB
MAGRSPVTATEDQKTALKALAQGADRAEADRARALLLTLDGWTSARIAQAFGVREDTVRLWRSDLVRGGVDALRARIAPGPVPLKAQGRSQGRRSAPVGTGGGSPKPDVGTPRRRDCAIRRPQHFTLAALKGAAQKGGFSFRRPRHRLKGRQCADEVGSCRPEACPAQGAGRNR